MKKLVPVLMVLGLGAALWSFGLLAQVVDSGEIHFRVMAKVENTCVFDGFETNTDPDGVGDGKIDLTSIDMDMDFGLCIPGNDCEEPMAEITFKAKCTPGVKLQITDPDPGVPMSDAVTDGNGLPMENQDATGTGTDDEFAWFLCAKEGFTEGAPDQHYCRTDRFVQDHRIMTGLGDWEDFYFYGEVNLKDLAEDVIPGNYLVVKVLNWEMDPQDP